MNPTTSASCTICFGKKTWGDQDYPCTNCAEPEPALVRKVPAMLEPKHMAFLRVYEHTLASQPVTVDEYKAAEFSVEDDDATIGDDYELLIPATTHWFATGQARLYHGESHQWIRYTPLGLALRECLMAGADVRVRS